jgi:UDP-glucuronate 4-epimerase
MANCVVVTGAAGFIGSHVCRWLLADGYTVVGIDDFNPYYDPAIKQHNIQPFLANPQFMMHTADIRDRVAMGSIFAGLRGQVSAVIHLAARAGVRPSIADPALYMDTNVHGTVNVAEMAHKAGAERFIFASSSSVYGDAADTVPFSEHQDVSRPISPYAATKIMAENWLHAFAHLNAMQVVCLRFFTVYGPSQRPDLAIYKFTHLIHTGQPVPFFGDGSTRRDYTYIEDILSGIRGAMAYQGPRFDVFNLGESQTTTLLQLVKQLESVLGKPALLDRQPTQSGDVTVTFANIDKARTLLGYDPKTPVSLGLGRFVDWYLNQPQRVIARV